MTAGGGWYHCSIKTVGRSAGRSVVAAAAYRLGAELRDETVGEVYDYRRRQGVATSFTCLPTGAPAWASDPERLWNAAERAERRINSTLARECELALPSGVSRKAREGIARDFAEQLVERYGVAVTVAIHEPSWRGDQRNHHAHILFTTRRMEPYGLGEKTRILDARKTGPQEVSHLREFACGLINEALAEAGLAERVDHRSFVDRGIDHAPSEHLGPMASAIERRDGMTERGDTNRETIAKNHQLDELVAELAALDAQIADEQERLLDERYGPATAEPSSEEVEQPPVTPQVSAKAVAADPPADAEAAAARVREAAAPFVRAIQRHGSVTDIQRDGLTWWERGAIRLGHFIEDMRSAVLDLRDATVKRWQHFVSDRRAEKNRDRDDGLDH
jgi:MobA/MobL family